MIFQVDFQGTYQAAATDFVTFFFRGSRDLFDSRLLPGHSMRDPPLDVVEESHGPR